MGRLKNQLLVVVGFAIAGLIGAAFGTGTAQAVVSTLVSVVNPTTSPVPTTVVNTTPVPTSSVNLTDPGRIPYQSRQTATTCDFIFPTVPLGHRVVIQHISGTIDFTGTPTQLLIALYANGVDNASFLVPIPTIPNASFVAFDQAVLLYSDESSVIQVAGAVYSSGSASCKGQILLTGYELDCSTVGSCAPIATQ